jgi:lysozyme
MAVQSNPLKFWGILFTLTMVIFIGGYFLYLHHFFKRSKYYKSFGISIPDNYQIHGIDVSHNQSEISWTDIKRMKVKNINIRFAFIKSTQGIYFKDPRFEENWNESKKAGLTRGAYHYFEPGVDGALQAQHFIKHVKLESGDLPPVLDVEQTNGLSTDEINRNVKLWLDKVEQYYHIKPIIYSYANFYQNTFSGKFDDYPLWIAHYNNANYPKPIRDWIFWQHSEKGHLNGIESYVDFNVFSGDSQSFKNLLMK